jgi:uncharacterized hydantoinase/oxoprolinase family protein
MHKQVNDVQAGFIACNNYIDNSISINVDVSIIIRSISENIYTKERPTGAGRQFFNGNWHIDTIKLNSYKM